jgi:small basic protein
LVGSGGTRATLKALFSALANIVFLFFNIMLVNITSFITVTLWLDFLIIFIPIVILFLL